MLTCRDAWNTDGALRQLMSDLSLSQDGQTEDNSATFGCRALEAIISGDDADGGVVQLTELVSELLELGGGEDFGALDAAVEAAQQLEAAVVQLQWRVEERRDKLFRSKDQIGAQK